LLQEQRVAGADGGLAQRLELRADGGVAIAIKVGGVQMVLID